MIGPLDWQAYRQRRRLKAWIEAPLSEIERDYRAESLAWAFGLRKSYILRLIEPPRFEGGGLMLTTGMGLNLMLAVLEWCAEHPDLGRNHPITDGDVTFFTDLDINSG